VFRRRRREEAESEPIEDEAPEDAEDWAAADEDEANPDPDDQEPSPATAGRGPWDAADDIPAADRVDFGSLQVPVAEGFEIQLNIADDQGPLIAVVRGDSSLQLQAFAAPKSGGLWDDVRQEIAAAVAQAGGSSEEAAGPFGAELHARVPGDPSLGQGGLQPVRFLGVDGPRWFLRGVITGPAASHASAAGPFEEAFAGVVVVRGDHPVPPRDLLEIQLPEEARQAMEEQMAAEEQRFGDPLNPFERGPEITETR
jgi:Protein of unknown function (DUF3710)